MAGPALAFMNHGRWVAQCGTCPGAERVWPGGQIREIDRGPNAGRRFGVGADGVLHCGSCGNTTPVKFPDDRLAIEKILSRRPAFANRNWVPGESMDDLAAENLVNGLEVD